ncbi:MAG: glycosyltransferase [Saprospiraceae bacterium]|nr:glycosyltransferase [Saprospiraceae bacterium]
MSILVCLIFFIYTAALVVITVYCLMQLHLLFQYKKHHFKLANRPVVPAKPALPSARSQFPFVTIQLPVYNEMYVIDRLIDNIMQMDYPRECFEVHVLDDSTDETNSIAAGLVERYKAQGFNIAQIRRSNRQGYKAGALKEAMHQAKGEFIAIFDADFLPKKDFLINTLAHFHNKKVGVVQTRWEHLNETYSILTRLQALQLNVHFSVEQQGRRAGNYLLQFNGTAGVWRRAAIEDAGGWEADTLTEDLDLSIRAQLRGWEIIYLEGVGSPAELPAEMNGLKSQQFRWMKGGAETAKKMLPTIWRSHLRPGQKIHATMQLFSSTIFVFVFILGVFSVPVLLLMGHSHFGSDMMKWCLIGFFAFLSVQYVANVELPFQKGGYLKRLAKFVFLFPLFLALSMGLSLHNTVAVVQGWLGRQSAFVRTPKFNILSLRDSFRSHQYLASKISWTTILEGLLAVYFLLAVWQGLQMDQLAFLLLHSLLALGYGAIFFYTLRHLRYK